MGVSIACLVLGSTAVVLEVVRATMRSAAIPRITMASVNTWGRIFSRGLAALVVTEVLPWMALLLGGMVSVKVVPSEARLNAGVRITGTCPITRSISGLRKRINPWMEV